MVIEEGKLKDKRLADLKLRYERNGWEWRW